MTNKTKRTFIISLLAVALLISGGILCVMILQDTQAARFLGKKE